MISLLRLHSVINRQIKDTLYSNSIESELRWLKNQNEPCSLIEASYYQYKAQIIHHTKNFHIFIEFISFIGYFLFLIRPNTRIKEASKSQDICIFLPNESYMPIKEGVLLLNYPRGYFVDRATKKMFLNDMKSYRYDYYFKLKLLVKTGMYCFLIETYHPKRLFCESEYSFTSSYLTKICREKNVLHCNIQHGEKLLNIGSSFFSFDEMYTWDERYISIYTKLRANVLKYYIFTPDFLLTDYSVYEEKYDYKYYMQNQPRDTMEKICCLMQLLKNQGFRVAVRMHPAYPDHYIEKKYHDLIESGITFEQSLGETKNAIAMFSMVLLQAEFAKKGAIVDDVSDTRIYNNAIKLGYIMLQKDPILLSEVVELNEN